MAAKPSKRTRKRKASKKRIKPAGRMRKPGGEATRSACWYDADRQPDAAAWLGRVELERIEEVELFHRQVLAKDELAPQPRLHATLHVLVENQIAMADPPETTLALERLQGEGMTRHQALHAIGWLVSRYMDDASNKQAAVDREGFRQELGAFGIQRWMDLVKQTKA